MQRTLVPTVLKSLESSSGRRPEASEFEHPADRTAPARESGSRVVGSHASTNGRPAMAASGRGGETASDLLVAEVVDEVLWDPDAIGLLLEGSRASATAGADSNYDFVCLLPEEAYERRRQRGTAVEHRFRNGSPPVQITYAGIGRFRRAAGLDSRPPFGPATVLVDKTGEIEPLLNALVAPRAPDRAAVADDYERYLHGFAHSLKALSRADDLGARAHAAQSAQHLVSALFGLEGKCAPYPDQLSVRLAELDEPQDWRSGFLLGALHRLLYAPDPPFQQMLERRVSRLMASRGVRHGWRHDLDRLRVVSYDEL